MNSANINPIVRPQAMRATTPMLASGGLPTLPGYVFRLNQLLSSAEPDLRPVVQVIRTDASLTAQVLRLANLYRLESQEAIATVRDAVTALGAQRVRTMVLTCPLLDCAANVKQWASLQSFWQHNFMTAVLSEAIANYLDYEQPEVAYTAGLLRDVGELSLIAQCNAEGTSWPQAEHSAIGSRARSKEAGRRLAIACKLTPDVVEVCSCDDPARAWHDPLLVKIVTSASQFCAANGLISGGDPQQLRPGLDYRQMPRQFGESFRMGPQRTDELTMILTKRFQQHLPGLEFNRAGLLSAAAICEASVTREEFLLASA